VEWFLNFYEAAQVGRVRPVEGVVHEGEILFVPRGWWHLAINLEVGSLAAHCGQLWAEQSLHDVGSQGQRAAT
jgi:mannose-6-phosphate isomerase-like protein (cupin superfamily)